MMKYLQKLGKSLMLPVACLPICGILMGIGYALSPNAMQGGDIVGVGPVIGFFLIKAGGALIDNMSWLFAIGVAVGMSDDHEGTSGLAGLVSWLVITTLLSSGTVAVLVGGEADPAFAKIQNQFIGIVAGIIGSSCYNKFKGNSPSGRTGILLRQAFRFHRDCSCIHYRSSDPVLHLAYGLRRSGNFLVRASLD